MLESLTVALDHFAATSLNQPLIAVPAYVLAGLAGSLFPCVYPLIPITAGFLQNRGRDGEHRWKHPLLYWFGTMLAYGLLGVLAALSGGAFNTVMQSGLAVTATGLLFLFLTFVAIDWFPLTWSTGDRLVAQAAGHKGAGFTVLMGGLAGFVASACVAPALVTMLLFIAQNIAANEALSGTAYAGQIAYGGLLSLSFGAGIGVPFFAAGVLGAKLPKSGRWMQIVKYGFGVLIFVIALYQLHKGFTTLGYDDMDVYMILGGIALLLLAVVTGLRPPQFAEDDPRRKRALVRFYFALLALIFAAGLVVRGMNPWIGGASSEEAAAADEFEMVGDLKFYRNEAYVMNLAVQQGRPVFVDFYADWCANCKDFQELTKTDAQLNEALSRALLLKIYDTDPVFEKYAADPRFGELQIGLPFFLVLAPDGEFVWKTVNYRDVAGMEAAIKKAASKEVADFSR